MTSAVQSNSESCADTCCNVGACRLKCAFEVVDELLSTPGAVSGDDLDLLLDLRSMLRRREDAEATLRMFCELRRRLEQQHYLAFYRLRCWLGNHLVAVVSPGPAAASKIVPVRLTHYCVEAVRRTCLCAAMEPGKPLSASRLSFAFRPDSSKDQAPARIDSSGLVPILLAGL